MRVLVSTGAFRHLTSAQTGAALARAWAELGAQCAVVPIAEANSGFGQAWADLVGARSEGLISVDGLAVELHHEPLTGSLCLSVHVPAADDVDPLSSAPVGRAVAQALADFPAPANAEAPRELLLEVSGAAWHDGGAGFLHALGARAEQDLDGGVDALAGVAGVDLAPVRERLAGAALTLVTSQDEAERHLVGLRGITSVRGHGRGDDPARMLATDQALMDLAAGCGAAALATTPGSGALGGLGFAVLLLAGAVVTGPQVCAGRAGLQQSMERADLVVTGYDELEFGTKGGDLLPLVTELAQQSMKPVVAFARRNWISARELRTMGIEQAYGLAPATDGEHVLDEPAIMLAAAPSARTWSW